MTKDRKSQGPATPPDEFIFTPVAPGTLEGFDSDIPWQDTPHLAPDRPAVVFDKGDGRVTLFDVTWSDLSGFDDLF